MAVNLQTPTRSVHQRSRISTRHRHAARNAKNIRLALLAAQAAAVAASEPTRTLPEYKPLKEKLIDVKINALQPSDVNEFELVIAGAGPAGLAVADRVSKQGFKVCVVDPEPLAPWLPNYGVWVDEFQAMGLSDYFEVVWPRAKVFLGDEPQDEKYLYRPYARVDREKLKAHFLSNCTNQGVVFHRAKVDGVAHGEGLSTLKCSDGTAIKGAMVVDATGHARKLVKFDQVFDPGYQAAYGITAVVDSHPFDLDTMIFMDWRDSHTAQNAAMQASNSKLPTFLYAMPLSPNRIFLEETSLVSRPPVPFNELKERLWTRLDHLGIKVKYFEEEEYCLIPMGGVLPTTPQRVLGIGGTAGMVHPSTGFMVSRALGAVPTLADAIVEELSRPTDAATNAGGARRAASENEAASMSTAVWNAIWPVERLRQREFFNFGMDVLLSLSLQQTRDFFRAFFGLSDFHWQGFLSARLGFSQLIVFGLALFGNSSNQSRLTLLSLGVPGLVKMLANLSKTIGK